VVTKHRWTAQGLGSSCLLFLFMSDNFATYGGARDGRPSRYGPRESSEPPRQFVIARLEFLLLLCSSAIVPASSFKRVQPRWRCGNGTCLAPAAHVPSFTLVSDGARFAPSWSLDGVPSAPARDPAYRLGGELDISGSPELRHLPTALSLQGRHLASSVALPLLHRGHCELFLAGPWCAGHDRLGVVAECGAWPRRIADRCKLARRIGNATTERMPMGSYCAEQTVLKAGAESFGEPVGLSASLSGKGHF